jgi:hypothetical protein
MTGRCTERPELADQPIPLTVGLPVVPYRGGDRVLRGLFEPPGYQVDATPIPLDRRLPEWGDSRYLAVTLSAVARLHPAEAFATYRADGIDRLVCQEKHMGSRAVAVCRDGDVARMRFGAPARRPGRSSPVPVGASSAILMSRRSSSTPCARRSTPPACGTSSTRRGQCSTAWSAKAIDLLRSQYASVGAAAMAALSAEHEALTAAGRRVDAAGTLASRAAERRNRAERFVDAYRRYC